METVIARKFNISTAFGFMANAINEEKTQLQQSLQVARGVIEAAQSESDTKSKSIGAKLFFHKLEDLAKNVYCTPNQSLFVIDEKNLDLYINKDSKEMFDVRPVVFPAIFLALYFFRKELTRWYNHASKIKVAYVVEKNNFIIRFSVVKKDIGSFIDFLDDPYPSRGIEWNDFLSGKAKDSDEIPDAFKVLRQINAYNDESVILFEKHPEEYVGIKPIHPSISFAMDDQYLTFTIKNAFKSED
jgi:hypothetical protein